MIICFYELNLTELNTCVEMKSQIAEIQKILDNLEASEAQKCLEIMLEKCKTLN